MKRMHVVLLGGTLIGLLCLIGCFPLQQTAVSQTENATAAAAEDAAAAATSPAKKENSSHQKTTFPQTLGGILSSDSWVIYQEKQEEEFSGQVNYDNGISALQADYVLSQRAKQLVTARGAVMIKHTEEDGTWYQLYANQALYNYQTGCGTATGKPVRLIYHTAEGDTFRARAKRMEFDRFKQSYILIGSAVVVRTDAQEQQTTLKAKRIEIKQNGAWVYLSGQAEAVTPDYHLQADRIDYDGKAQLARAEGSRALAQGTAPDGTFAIIADKVSTHTDTRQTHMEGKVQGWIVSEKINSAAANPKL